MLGALLALALPGSTLRVVFAVFLAVVGVKLIRDGLVRPERSGSEPPPQPERR